MNLTPKTYRHTASLLWTAVGVLAALTVGIYFSATPRTQIFMAVLGGGMVLLFRLNKLHYNHTPAKIIALPAGKMSHLTGSNQVNSQKKEPGAAVEASTHDLVAELLAHEDKLSSDEARKWLDDLLVEQQK